MRRLYGCFYIFNLFIFSMLSSIEMPPGPSAPVTEHSSSLESIIQANSQFAFDLFHKLKNKRGNLFFAPYSISSAFALAIAGAKRDTASEMEDVLHYAPGTFPLMGELNHELLTSSPIKNGPQLLLADAIWAQSGLTILPAFKLTTEQIFEAPLQFVNFRDEPSNAIRTINQWVSNQTRGKINQLINPQDISKETRMILTSAMYMKGRWAYPFDPKSTVKAPFYLLNRQNFPTLMMKRTATYPLLIDQQFAMIELPYLNLSDQGAQLSMIIILPNEDVGLDTIEEAFTYDHWKQWFGQLNPKRVNLTLPQFRLDERLDLNLVMKELGMIKAFSPLADFSGITGHKDLYLSKAIHKTFIKVDEEGTEAAATVGISLSTTSVLSPEEPYNFIANRPFLFLIIDDKTQSILFMGRLMQP